MESFDVGREVYLLNCWRQEIVLIYLGLGYACRFTPFTNNSKMDTTNEILFSKTHLEK